eukprot:COSAG06_NODE_12323_length_1395_cov_1.470679_2_plen_116_part_00
MAESEQGEITGDTIALVTTAVLGIVSFIINGQSAAKNRDHQAEIEREAAAAEAERDRTHQRTEAQFARTNRWLDECCRPIFTLLVTMSQSRVNHVIGFVKMLVRSFLFHAAGVLH